MRASGFVLTLVGVLGISWTASAQTSISFTPTSAEEAPVVPATPPPSFTSLVDAMGNAKSERQLHQAFADAARHADAHHAEMARIVSERFAGLEERTLAAWALGERGTPAACSAVGNASTHNADDALVYAIAMARARCGDTTMMRSILERSNDDMTYRAKAAAALGLLNDRRSLSLVARLADGTEEGEIRDGFIVARGLMGDTAVREQLLDLLKSRTMHMHAAIALVRMGYDAGVFDLIAASRSREGILRQAAAELLIAKRARGACSALENLTNDPDSRVHKLANDTLNAWETAAWNQWVADGFALDHFGPSAYCP